MILTYYFMLFSVIKITVFGQCDFVWNNKVNYNTAAERVYYIGCVEVEWDYAPSGKNLVTGEAITSSTPEATWLIGNGVNRIGSKYMKALYREFTDNCFTTQKIRSKDDEHLGALGPNIRALTNEKIKIFYKNMCTIPTSMHGHGVGYDKLSEGTPYADNDGITQGDIVPPNGKWIYIWHARPNMIDAGTSSKMWLYHSHVDEIGDVHAGLFGAIIITQSGFQTSATNLKPKDIDREFTTFFVMYDENKSTLVNTNFNKYLGRIPPQLIRSNADFIEANLMHSINGYLFGNLDDLLMTDGEIVRWYTASFGNEGDGPHSPHWHGNIVVDPLGDNTDTVVLIPGTTYTVTMTIDEAGIWLYHCHVFDHIEAGMITTYTVGLPELPGPTRTEHPPLPPNAASYYCGIPVPGTCTNAFQRIVNPRDGFLFECDGEYVCSNSIFDIECNEPSQPVNQFQGILCKTRHACNGAVFNIGNYQSNVGKLRIDKVECADVGACNGMVININSNVNIEEVVCDVKGRCDGCIINVIDQPAMRPISCDEVKSPYPF